MNRMSVASAETGAPPAESVLQHLKRATQPVHDALEASPVALRIMAEEVTQENVLVFLQANYACLSGLEASVLAQLGGPALCDTLGYTLQAPALERDFRLMGSELPEVRPVVFGSDPVHALGVLYVLMGSQFGKAVIRRHLLRKALDVDVLQFFETPERLAERWRQFGAQLDVQGLNRDRVIDGAMDGFKHFMGYWAGRINENPG